MKGRRPGSAAVRVSVVRVAGLDLPDRPDLKSDYADAFAAPIDPASNRTSLDWARAVFEGGPVAARWFLLLGWRVGLGLPLGPRPSADHVLGWPIIASAPEMTRLRLQSKLLSSLVEYQLDADRLVLTTRVTYLRPAARLLWGPTAPIHRLIIPYLLRRAATAV